MKRAERGELKHLSRVQQGYSFTGLICPEWCLTPLKAHILALHLNPSWIFRSKKRLRISQVPPKGLGWRRKKKSTGWSGERAGEGGGCGLVSITCLCLSSCLLGAQSPHFTLLIKPPPPPQPGPDWTELSPGGLLSTSHRQGGRRSCNWNTDYMNNEPQTTIMTRKRDQGLETIMNMLFW